ncbi:MAG: hypothetical protein WCI49_06315 [Ferruginibacter sp.]
MKKLCLAGILFSCSIVAFSQKKKTVIEGKALYFGGSYSNPIRAEFDKYMAVLSDSLKFTNPLLIKKNFGIQGGLIIRNGKGEFEAGGSYSFGISAKMSNANNTSTATLSTNSFDIHFGYSQYIAGPLFIGFDIGVLSNDGKFTVAGNNATFLEPTPESHNPFKGYVFFARPKGGFFFPFKKDALSGFKLTAFYDMSISKYDFYNKDIFQNRIKNYKGETKSSFKALGVQATISFAMDN